VLAAGACISPIGVSLSRPEEVHRAVTQSVLTSGKPSPATEQFLHRLGLADRFDEDPAGTLEELRGPRAGLSRDRLFTLAELSFIYAQRENRREHYLASAALQNMPTVVDNMRSGNGFVRTLADSPLVAGVPAHSIIAVLGEGPVSGKTDGLVAYESAHLDGVESEKIVRAPHSCQAEPDTILEVRRILLEHLAAR
jgi:hypothetical protein